MSFCRSRVVSRVSCCRTAPRLRGSALTPGEAQWSWGSVGRAPRLFFHRGGWRPRGVARRPRLRIPLSVMCVCWVGSEHKICGTDGWPPRGAADDTKQATSPHTHIPASSSVCERARPRTHNAGSRQQQQHAYASRDAAATAAVGMAAAWAAFGSEVCTLPKPSVPPSFQPAFHPLSC